ncbi:MAG: metallophosphatase [Bacteroidia bacterium]|nr:metallophosphatase [Bacteroidia bacterium]
MSDRRAFIRQLVAGGIGLSFLESYGSLLPDPAEFVKLTVLHTNDVHSHIDPFPNNDPRYPGWGGAGRRAALIRRIRQEETHVLLLDAGDTFQGTPYFNYYGGELEFKLMTEMGYDASTIGNHDFDNGLEGLEKQLPHAGFPFLCSNYDFSNTVLHDKTLAYKIFQKGPLKIGVFGLGIELEGLVMKKNYGKTIYKDPIRTAAHYARFLRYDLGCDLVICLSHLGYKYPNKKFSDTDLAEISRNIDLIIGGHTHTLLEKPVTVKNSAGKQVLVSQVGWGGVALGRIDYFFHIKKKKNTASGKGIIISDKVK